MEDNAIWFLNELNDEQKQACICNKNYLLTACPGSGKTRTITYRLAYLVSFYPLSRKINAAITYTNRAANEIRERVDALGIDDSSIWTGTIHQFCLEYIIRPYSMYSPRLSQGYKIIDERIQEIYAKKACDDLGLKFWSTVDALMNISVLCIYQRMLEERKELDFEMILKVALELLKNNGFIGNNISKIFRSIQVDEFQDTNETQYEILATICKFNKAINVSFTGDVNQAIYGGIGGVAKTKTELEVMFESEFLELHLCGCYRSTQRLVEYYCQFQVINKEVVSVSENRNLCGTLYYSLSEKYTTIANTISEIINEQIDAGVPDKEICVMAPQWWMLYQIGNELKVKLPDICFDSPELTPIKYDPMNPFYLIARLLFTKPGRKVKYRKRVANEILEIFSNDYKVMVPYDYETYDLLRTLNSVAELESGIDMLKHAIDRIFKDLVVDLQYFTSLNEAMDSFFEKIQYRINKYNLEITTENFKHCFHEKNGVVISTFHGVKGEEYTTVIGFGLLTGYVPNWKTIYADSESANIEAKHLIYVICSRAKLNLYLFSEQGHTTKNGNPYYPTAIMQ